MPSGDTISVATWNIGGAILGPSHQTGGKPQLDYYADILRTHQPDIVCLQEAHHYYDEHQPNQTQQLAKLTDYPHTVSVPISPSHLDPNAQLGLGVISRFPIQTHRYVQLPNPGLYATGPNGEQWVPFDKGYLVV